MMVDALVIGGGVSGLAAAVQLSLDGATVMLVEQSSRLGGRAYSYVDAKTGDVVDNGQHVLVGAYHSTLRYLELIGTRHFLHEETPFQLQFHHPTRGFGSFTLSRFHEIFGKASAVLSFSLVSLRDRLRMLAVGNSLNHDRLHTLKNLTVAEWLRSLNQTEETNRSFWFPLATSIMNESPEKASAYLLAHSLQETIFGNPTDAALLIPTVGQSELYVIGAEQALRNRRATVLKNSEVTEILVQKGKTVGVRLKNRKTIHARRVICAVPYFALARIIPEPLRNTEPFAHLSRFQSSPIVSINLWFDRAVMERNYVGLIDRSIQWVFNRRRILHENGKSRLWRDKPENYISTIISGAHSYIDVPKEKLVKLAVKDLASAFPAARKASVMHSVVVKEKRATFSATNEVEPLRPSQQTPFENLFLAGDWTDTGFPPTIEGAIMSGFRCAELAAK